MYIMVQQHLYNNTVVRGEIHYGVVACIQLYSGERTYIMVQQHVYNYTVVRETYIMVQQHVYIYTVVRETYIMVQQHVYNYTVMRGDIHNGVVACLQSYSGEGRHALRCSSMYTVYTVYSGKGRHTLMCSSMYTTIQW